MARVEAAGWLRGQTISTLQPALEKAMAKRAVANHRQVVANNTFNATGVPRPQGAGKSCWDEWYDLQEIR
jgi:hypothetical protein